ncbi:hypothetical protein [Buttiauxella noackiae]|uniref:hypothetical protein n=1 Tax=Buttiauxella noackiae TaxID=82992 RepID=UPI00054E649B|nr:hypothetical protein [Buttiauxella noackiae]
MSDKEIDSYVQGTDHRNISAREAHTVQIAPEITNNGLGSNTEYSPASGANVLLDNGRMMNVEMPDTSSIDALAEFRKQETLAGAMRDRGLYLRTLTPTEARIEVEREYIPELKRLYGYVYDAKSALDEYQDDEANFITKAVIQDVYVMMTSPEYKKIHCHGPLHYNNTILKDSDLMQNWYEIKRSSVAALPGAASYDIWYLPRGVVQKDLEVDSAERAKAAYISGRPALVRTFNRAYEIADAKKKEFQKALAEIPTSEGVIGLFKQCTAMKNEIEKSGAK